MNALERVWRERNSRYARLKYTLTESQIEAVRVYRVREAELIGNTDMVLDARHWTPPPRIA